MINLVTGYLPNIDNADRKARQNGLHKRVAVVLDTYRPGHGEAYYDYDLIAAILNKALPLFGYNKACVYADVAVFNYVSEPLLYKFNDGTDDNPFDRIELFSGDNIVCVVNALFYTAIGGPQPYHDSYTFEIFYKDIEEQTLLNCIISAAIDAGTTVQDIYNGGPEEYTSLLTKLKRLL